MNPAERLFKDLHRAVEGEIYGDIDAKVAAVEALLAPLNRKSFPRSSGARVEHTRMELGSVAVNLHQLRVFAAIVEHGSFTRAAEELHLTQPAVSAQIRQLRAVFRTRLLLREGRRVVVTPAGAALYDYARHLLVTTDSLLRDMTQIMSGAVDRVVVAGNRSYGTYVLPYLVAQFQVTHPAIRVTLVDAPSDGVIHGVRNAEFDVGVVFSLRVPKELVVSHAADDALVVVESTRRPVVDQEFVSLEQVSDKPFIRTLLVGTQGGSRLDHLLLAAGLEPRRIVMEVPTWEGIKTAVRAGVGLATALSSVVSEELASGEFRAVRVAGYQDVRPVMVICPPRRPQRHLGREFNELLTLLSTGIQARLNLPSAER